MKYKITAKEPVTGTGWGLSWADGIATTDNLAIANKLAGKGYTVEEMPGDTTELPEPSQDDIDISKWTVAQLKEFAADNGIDIGSAAKKDDIINAIVAASKPTAETAAALSELA